LNDIRDKSGEFLLGLKEPQDDFLCKPAQFSEYTVYFIPQGQGTFHADFGAFPFVGPVLLFSTPLQVIYIDDCRINKSNIIQFHSDFYCIEYHREEVACNGLLFNNIYLDPVVILTEREAGIFDLLLGQINDEFMQPAPSDIVLRAFLQLFLAKASTIKMSAISSNEDKPEKDDLMERFRQLLNEHFLDLHKPSDYASLLAISPDTLTRRCSKYFHKSPSQLIQERLILEAKKQLHLTRQSIKEIAYNLKFQDEFYFSRVFKKFTKVSPQTFRDKTGISIVADLYK
jgi:AraC family transcriptional activator of pobA